MTILTPELASAMLTIYRRRLRDDPSTHYTVSLLDAALWGEGPTSQPLPNFIRKLRSQYDGGRTTQRRSDSAWLR